MTENNKGFELALDFSRSILRIRAWGHWDVEFAKKYSYAMRERVEKMSADREHWYALVDFTEFLPQSEVVQCIVHEHPTSNIERRTSNQSNPVRRWTLNVRCSMFVFFKRGDHAVTKGLQWGMNVAGSLLVLVGCTPFW